MCQKGLVHIYTGEGKGKTTAAIGLCVRMAGAGGKTLFLQFMKGAQSSEISALRRLGVEVHHGSSNGKFLWEMTETEKAAFQKEQERLLAEAETYAAGDFAMVVLDEAISAVSAGLLREEALLDLLKKKAGETEIVITGRGASSHLMEHADYVSVIEMKKHPFEHGTKARKGIEF